MRGTSIENVLFIKTFMSLTRGRNAAASLSCAVTRGKAADAGNPNRKRFACQNVRESVAGQKRRVVIVPARSRARARHFAEAGGAFGEGCEQRVDLLRGGFAGKTDPQGGADPLVGQPVGGEDRTLFPLGAG